jgi:tetratricopeptide (TPR) repeat protein
MRKSTVLMLAAVCFGTAWPASVAAQAAAGDRPGHDHHRTMTAGGNFGQLSFPNSGNQAAQTPFLRGVKLLHNFQYEEAIEAFQEAQKADADFALAYWGEAMAHNYTLWAEQHTDQARAILARLGHTADQRAAKAKTEREKMWLSAVEALYGAGTKFERDNAYADRMDALFAAYPNDLEARVFDALATMGRSHGTRDTGNYMKAAAMLERVFHAHTHHPGIVHYLIHAYDDAAHASLGLRAARLYDKIAPDSAHAQHMTSHIFLAMGMWPEAEQANVRAIAVGNAMAEMHHESPGACGHPFIWLVYAKLQQGKDTSNELQACRAEAEAKLKDAHDLPVVGFGEGSSGSWADMAVRSGVETGNWPNWIELPAGKMTFVRFTEDYGRLLSSRRDAMAAASALKAMQAERDILTANYAKEFPDDDQTLPWIDRAVAQAEAVVALAKGESENGLKLLRAAADAEAALPPPFGPPALQKPSYELLGDELLALGLKSEAADAYRRALAAAPQRRLSVAGLKAANTPSDSEAADRN